MSFPSSLTVMPSRLIYGLDTMRTSSLLVPSAGGKGFSNMDSASSAPNGLTTSSLDPRKLDEDMAKSEALFDDDRSNVAASDDGLDLQKLNEDMAKSEALSDDDRSNTAASDRGLDLEKLDEDMANSGPPSDDESNSASDEDFDMVCFMRFMNDMKLFSDVDGESKSIRRPQRFINS